MNHLTQYFVPQWIAVLFLLVIPVPVILLALLAQKGAPEKKKKAVFYTVLGFYALYFAYVTAACLNGLFNRVFFPPVILLYATFPLKIFLFAFVIRLAVYKTILNNVLLEDLVKVHVFRLIGVFFLFLAYYETLPAFFAIVAGLGDMISAVSSIFVARAIQNKKLYAKKLTLFWNSFGLADILFTAISAIVLTKISIDTGRMGVDTLAQFPLCLIPAFAPPTIIFLHVAIYKKIKKNYP
jgi:hypothetical protein